MAKTLSSIEQEMLGEISGESTGLSSVEQDMLQSITKKTPPAKPAPAPRPAPAAPVTVPTVGGLLGASALIPPAPAPVKTKPKTRAPHAAATPPPPKPALPQGPLAGPPSPFVQPPAVPTVTGLLGLDRIPAVQQMLQNVTPQPAPGPYNPNTAVDLPRQLGDKATNAFGRGVGQAADMYSMVAGNTDALARGQQTTAALPPSAAYTRAMSGSIKDMWDTIRQDPSVLLEMGVEQVGREVGNLPVRALGLMGGVAGNAAASFLTSMGTSATSRIIDAYRKAGVDVNDAESLAKAFADKKKFAGIRNQAVTTSLPSAVFDAVSAGVAGRLLADTAGKPIAKKIAATLAEFGIQAGLGMGGELGDQLIEQKGDLSKISGPAVLAEGIMEIPGGAVDIGAGMMARGPAKPKPSGQVTPPTRPMNVTPYAEPDLSYTTDYLTPQEGVSAQPKMPVPSVQRVTAPLETAGPAQPTKTSRARKKKASIDVEEITNQVNAMGKEESNRILSVLSDTAPMHEDDVISRTSLPPAQVTAGLFMLELDGKVQRKPGNVYVRLQEPAPKKTLQGMLDEANRTIADAKAAREAKTPTTPPVSSPQQALGDEMSAGSGEVAPVGETGAQKGKDVTNRTYRYRVTVRPIGLGTVPDGYTNPQTRDTAWNYGTVEYNKPLTGDEPYQYSLVPEPAGKERSSTPKLIEEWTGVPANKRSSVNREEYNNIASLYQQNDGAPVEAYSDIQIESLRNNVKVYEKTYRRMRASAEKLGADIYAAEHAIKKNKRAKVAIELPDYPGGLVSSSITEAKAWHDVYVNSDGPLGRVTKGYMDEEKKLDRAEKSRDGKPVPPAVLADYPDLSPAPAPESSVPAPAAPVAAKDPTPATPAPASVAGPGGKVKERAKQSPVPVIKTAYDIDIAVAGGKSSISRVLNSLPKDKVASIRSRMEQVAPDDRSEMREELLRIDPLHNAVAGVMDRGRLVAGRYLTAEEIIERKSDVSRALGIINQSSIDKFVRYETAQQDAAILGAYNNLRVVRGEPKVSIRSIDDPGTSVLASRGGNKPAKVTVPTSPVAENEKILAFERVIRKAQRRLKSGTLTASQAEAQRLAIAAARERRRVLIAEQRAKAQRVVEQIKPAPIAGGRPKPIPQMVKDWEHAVNRKVLRGIRPDIKGRSIAGSYDAATGRIVVRSANDLGVVSHESMGHYYDDAYGYTNHLTPAMETELAPFVALSRSARTVKGNQAKLQEGFSEWMESFILNPDEATRQAPLLAAMVEARTNPVAWKALKTYSDDVRTYLGATGVEQTLANVRLTPRPSGLVEYVKGIVETEQNPGSLHMNFLDRVLTDWENRNHPILVAIDRQLKSLGNTAAREGEVSALLPSDDPRILLQNLGGIDGKVQQIIADGMIDVDGNIVGPSLVEMLEPLRSWEDMETTVAYMINERVMEKAGVLGRTDRISGAGAGLTRDTFVAAKAFREIVDDPETFAMVQDAAKRYRAHADAVLRYYRDSGRITPEQYQFIVDENWYYAAMHVTPEELASPQYQQHLAKGLARAKDNLKKFEGSARQRENPYTSLLNQTLLMVGEADRNTAMEKFVDLFASDRKFQRGEVPWWTNVISKGKKGDPQTVTVWRAGVPEYWHVGDIDLYNAMKGLGEIPSIAKGALEILDRVGRGYASTVRWGALHTPGFVVRNIIRDYQHGLQVSSVPGRHGAPTLGTAEEQRLFALYGGEQSTLVQSTEPEADYTRMMREAMKRLGAERNTVLAIPGKVAGVVNILGTTLQKSEQAGRMREFRKAYRHGRVTLGYDQKNAALYAAFQARTLLDYRQAGRVGRYLNRWFPFFNARLQGFFRTARAAKHHPRKFALQWALYSLTPTLLVYALNALRGHLEEYRELPSWRRAMFWNIKVGPDLWVSIPKNYEVGVMTHAVERAFDLMDGTPNAFQGYGENLASNSMPIDETSMLGILKPFYEQITNYDLFYGRPIVSYWEKDKDLSQRKGTEYASGLGQAQQKLTKWDARRFDHAVRSLFAGVGSLALQASTPAKQTTPSVLSAVTGVVKGGSGGSPTSYQQVLRLANKRGMTAGRTISRKELAAMGLTKEVGFSGKHSNPLKELREAQDAFYNAKGQQEREKAAHTLSTMSQAMREAWAAYEALVTAYRKMEEG